ncbi:MAG: AraC family transcriptional regulator [Rhodobacteraceae bacterium]|nr:AraC family transcriptional regulator [Paracoccaceae bacterium]
MDVLSSILQNVRLTGAVFFDVRAQEPFVAETPDMEVVGKAVMPESEHVVPFHIMMRGSCWIESTNSSFEPVKFDEGDVVIFPHGHGHAFVTTLGDRCPPELGMYRRFQDHPLPFVVDFNDHGVWDTRFVCGYLGLDPLPFNPLLEALPDMTIAKRTADTSHIEVDLINEAIGELATDRSGGEAILARLSELLFVRVLRRYIEEMPDYSAGWLAGIKDPKVRKALIYIHADPSKQITLDDLAKSAAMSRSAFSERFTSCVGESPMHYLTRWRMSIASQLLRHTHKPVHEIAECAGYSSETAFQRAFKNIVGHPPGKWRRLNGSSVSGND